jgi:hypothetical protein
MKNLVIVPVGDESLHPYWLKTNHSFDLALIYFGSDTQKADKYSLESKFFIRAKGNKYKLIFKFYKEFEEIIHKNYKYVWMPDDDVLIEGSEIDRLFKIAEQAGMILAQPAMKGYISHKITKPKFLSYLRFTNFIEGLAPLMEISVFKKLSTTFCLNESSWGYEFLWVKLLGNPIDKIGIIDSVKMIHTLPQGRDYSRFSKLPFDDLKELNAKFELGINLTQFNKNFITYKTIYKRIYPFKKHNL